MAVLRIYKSVYRIIHTINGDEYELINPNSISAVVVNYANSNLIETPVVTQFSTGVYYATMESPLYDANDVYEIRWSIRYTASSPIKTLKNRFTINLNGAISVVGVITNVFYEQDSNDDIVCEIDNQEEKIIELSSENEYNIIVNNDDIQYEVNNNNEQIIEIIKND